MVFWLWLGLWLRLWWNWLLVEVVKEVVWLRFWFWFWFGFWLRLQRRWLLVEVVQEVVIVVVFVEVINHVLLVKQLPCWRMVDWSWGSICWRRGVVLRLRLRFWLWLWLWLWLRLRWHRLLVEMVQQVLLDRPA